MALWQRAEADVADVWAVVLLLRGRGKEAAAFLDALPPSAAADGDDAEPARLTFARALARPSASASRPTRPICCSCGPWRPGRTGTAAATGTWRSGPGSWR